MQLVTCNMSVQNQITGVEWTQFLTRSQMKVCRNTI